jgi:hypothetical protein
MDSAQNAIAQGDEILPAAASVMRRKKSFILLTWRASRFRRHRAAKKEAPAVLWSRAGAFS